MVLAADALITAYRSGHKALFFGNGGSAADAQHLAAEFSGDIYANVAQCPPSPSTPTPPR